jgi:hypothetical protein
MLDRLDSAIKAAGIPIDGVSGEQGSIVIQFRPEATAQNQTDAAAIVAAFDWSDAAHNAWLAEQRAATVGRINLVRLAANRVNSTNVLADVTDLSFPLKPNSHYVFAFTGAYTAQAGTTGLSLGMNGPVSPALFRLIGAIAESATATRQGATGAFNTALTGTASGGATALPFWLEGNISTNAAGGMLQLRFASEVNGSTVTILAGSWGELKAVG